MEKWFTHENIESIWRSHIWIHTYYTHRWMGVYLKVTHMNTHVWILRLVTHWVYLKVTHMTLSLFEGRTYEYTHITRIDEWVAHIIIASCYTCRCVMSRVWMCHVANMYFIIHLPDDVHICDMTHIWWNTYVWHDASDNINIRDMTQMTTHVTQTNIGWLRFVGSFKL